MVDYKRIKTQIAAYIIACTMAATSLAALSDFKSVTSQKTFEKLPKAQQEIVIKLRNDKTPEKTVKLNIAAYTELIRLTKVFENFVTHEERVDLIPVTNISEQAKRMVNKSELINKIVALHKNVSALAGKNALIDKEQIELSINSMNQFKEKLETDIEILGKMQFRN
jgi:hypothetical protein